MVELFRQLSSNLVERAIIATIAAVLATYIMTERLDGRVRAIESNNARLQAKMDAMENTHQNIAERLGYIAAKLDDHDRSRK
jgi:hypothetical protein